MQSSESKSRLTSIIDYAHLIYLGLLPSLATFSLLYAYGHPAPLLLFLGGAVAVAVYLAVTFSYTPSPASAGWGLVILLDGPLWVLLSLLTKRVNPLAFAIEGFLVDGTAVWLSILLLATRSELPREQRTASIAFMLAALAATASLIFPYMRDELRGRWTSVGLLIAGVIESTIVRFRALSREKAEREDLDSNTIYLVVLILAWVASLILGNVLHELRAPNL